MKKVVLFIMLLLAFNLNAQNDFLLKSYERPIFEVDINGNEVFMLIGTGSGLNVVDFSQLEDLGIKRRFKIGDVVCIAGGSMFIIVGLGNPTRQYEGTKHNVGFDTIDYLIDEYQIPSSGAGHKALFGKGMIAGQKVIVAKPMTYMTTMSPSKREKFGRKSLRALEKLATRYTSLTACQN